VEVLVGTAEVLVGHEKQSLGVDGVLVGPKNYSWFMGIGSC